MLLSDERHKILNIPWSTEIDLLNVTYKNLFEAAGNEVDAIKELLVDYLVALCAFYNKDACIVPVEYLNYVCSMCSKNFGYRDFRRAISEFQSRYSVIVHECNVMNDWRLDYLTYKTFTDALQEAEESYSLKIHTGTLDEEDWESEYICIQKKDRKIK